MTPARVLVIGAGPSGLATAIGLGDDVPCTVLERRAEVGGLCGSLELDGAVFDVGGHSFSTPHPHVRELVFGALPMFEQRREARCWVGGALIDYPFQRHFPRLSDAAIVRACADGLAVADGGRGAADFEDYVVRRFGTGIAAHFLLPYNRKLWARDLRRLATDWVGERVAAPRVAADAPLRHPGRRMPLAEHTVVAYPASGGFGAITRALARRVADLRVDTAVVRIDLARRRLETASGCVLGFERLVSTIAPADLLAMIREAPAALRASAAALESVSLALVLAVVDHRIETEVQRIYVADPAVLAHKIVLNSNSSDALRRRPHHGVVAEVAFSSEKPLPAGDLAARVVDDLVALGVVGAATEVRGTTTIRIEHAYPVPTHDRARRVREIRAWLAERGVFTIGRLGEWDYVNSDECLHRGLVLGRSLAVALSGGSADQASA